MKKVAAALAVAAILFAGGWNLAFATPSTTYWSPATSDIQSYGVWHIGIDNYYTLGGDAGKTGDLPTDIGLTVGVLPFEKLQLEVGIDLLEPATEPVYFNAKLGTPENSLFEGSPALNIGIYNVGTKRDGAARTDQDIMHVMVGKTIPMNFGRLHVGGYMGNDKILVDKNGKKDNTGFMIGYDKGFLPAKDGKDEYNKWVFAADYQSGNNAVGAGGFGIYHYFTKDISLLTGPVWFNDSKAAIGNSDIKWVWTTQLDINF
ncbi:MAG: hypothetical protein HY026_08890 [Deltaproteobacteria bacterium]|nr:hypothetical protein [Deltaproteobacteria bacterium]